MEVREAAGRVVDLEAAQGGEAADQALGGGGETRKGRGGLARPWEGRAGVRGAER